MSGASSQVAASFADVEPQDKRLYCDKLASKLSSSSVGERIAALTAVFVIRDKNLSAHLLRMAKDSSSSVRRFAVFYLGELRAKYSIPVVNELLSDKSPEVRAAARDAYRKISGPSTQRS
jgi:HEAT repeat protein